MFIFDDGNLDKRTSIAMLRMSELVNFPIDLMITDKLEIPGFTYHMPDQATDQQKRMQKIGLTADLWTEWFKSIVQSQHIGFSLENKDRHNLMDWNLHQFSSQPLIYNGHHYNSSILSAMNIGTEIKIEERVENLSYACEEVYEPLKSLAVAQAAMIPEFIKEKARTIPFSELSPSDFWTGSQQVKAELEWYWIQYKLSPETRVYHLSDFERIIMLEPGVASEINDLLKDEFLGKEKLIQFYFVNYWGNFIKIFGSSVIVGLNHKMPNKSFPLEKLKEMLIDAVRADDNEFKEYSF
jgi:hypothetical protein